MKARSAISGGRCRPEGDRADRVDLRLLEPRRSPGAASRQLSWEKSSLHSRNSHRASKSQGTTPLRIRPQLARSIRVERMARPKGSQRGTGSGASLPSETSSFRRRNPHYGPPGPWGVVSLLESISSCRARPKTQLDLLIFRSRSWGGFRRARRSAKPPRRARDKSRLPQSRRVALRPRSEVPPFRGCKRGRLPQPEAPRSRMLPSGLGWLPSPLLPAPGPSWRERDEV